MPENEKSLRGKAGQQIALVGLGTLCRVCTTLGGCERDWCCHRGHRMGDQNAANAQFGSSLVEIRPDHRLITALDGSFRLALGRTSHQRSKTPGVVVRFSLLSGARDAHEKISVGFGGAVDCFRLGGRALQCFRSGPWARSRG